jgi:hypothetical protein
MHCKRIRHSGKSLRSDFPNVADEEFAILLKYPKEHVEGPDEQANEMISLVELAIKIKALKG